MHEWALAEAVIETVILEAEKEGIKEIINVKIMIGELQQIDLDIFKFALENFMQPFEPLLNTDKMNIEIDKCILKCRVCNHKWSYGDTLKTLDEDEAEAIHFLPEAAHVYMRCPRCNSSDFEIIKGRGVWIDTIEGEK
jgi:hydrogenase nickel incorporation protein HypA/HybF